MQEQTLTEKEKLNTKNYFTFNNKNIYGKERIKLKSTRNSLCLFHLTGDKGRWRKQRAKKKNNAVSVDQTHDLQIFNLTLSQLSYPRLLVAYKHIELNQGSRLQKKGTLAMASLVVSSPDIDKSKCFGSGQ
ncbi:hypothetical protein GQ457_05G001440 [Hibiscus cannabinus]